MGIGSDDVERARGFGRWRVSSRLVARRRLGCIIMVLVNDLIRRLFVLCENRKERERFQDVRMCVCAMTS